MKIKSVFLLLVVSVIMMSCGSAVVTNRFPVPAYHSHNLNFITETK